MFCVSYKIRNLIMLIFLLTLKIVPCLAAVQGDVELLKTIAIQHKTNFDSLLTWKGEAYEESKATKEADKYSYFLNNKCTFAYDRLQQAVIWTRSPQDYRLVSNGEQTNDKEYFNSIMVKDQTSYDYHHGGVRIKDGTHQHHLVIDDPKVLSGWIGHCLDPRQFFFNQGKPIHDRLMFLYDNVNNPKLSGIYIEREGNIVTLTIERPRKEGTIIEKQIFDLSAGGNLIKYYNEWPGAEITREYEYEEKSGVWVPKSYKELTIAHHKNRGLSKSGDYISTRIINWGDSVVNVPFDEDEFTVQKLGIKPGDRVSDHKIGIAYTYGEFLASSQSLKELNTSDIPVETVIQENDEEIEEIVEENTSIEEEVADETDTLAENHIHQTLATHGTHTYIYIIAVAFIIGLAGVAYMLNRRLRKE